MQGEFLHMMVIDQTIYFFFQAIGKQDRGLDRPCPEARWAILRRFYVHGGSNTLTCDLHQAKLTQR